MRTFKHLFFTWILTLALLPLCYLPYIGAEGVGDIMEKGLFLVFMGMLISIPALLICSIFLQLLLRTRIKLVFKFLLWVITVLLSAIGDGYLVFCIFFRDLHLPGSEVLELIMPAMIAGLFSLLLRYDYFMRLAEANEEDSGVITE